jgi:hypothetical protein
MSHRTMSQENNGVTVTTEDNEERRTMSRAMTTSVLTTVDAIAPFDMGGNTQCIKHIL